MFLNELNHQQKEAFFTLAREFVEVDDVFHPEEKKVLEQMRREMELAEDIDPADNTKERTDLLEHFDDRPAQIIVLLELLGLGYADDDFSFEESDFVLEVSDAFGVSNHKLKELENWVLRQHALTHQARNLIDG